jgi:hypothetical protein
MIVKISGRTTSFLYKDDSQNIWQNFIIGILADEVLPGILTDEVLSCTCILTDEVLSGILTDEVLPRIFTIMFIQK